jgi:hypothetical protein
MLRGMGYVIARRDHDPEEPHDWARLIEAFFRSLRARLAGRSVALPEQPQDRLHGRESASARRPR